MSKYTTGELARLCGVTVRTVQYYDTRGILAPSKLTDGGRRLYSADDLKRMKIICFLREIDMPIDAISNLLAEQHPEHVITLLIEQQEHLLNNEINEKQRKLNKLLELQDGLRTVKVVSFESIGDIALLMENKKNLKKVHRNMILAGIPVGILQWGSIILWIITGIWWPFVVWLLIIAPFALLIGRYYFNNVKYICPECHEVFKPAFKEAFFGVHTPSARVLTCPHCGHHGYCVEIWGGDAK